MLPAAMRRTALIGLCLLALTGCSGTEYIDLPENASEADATGAKIFYERCAACHTLDVTGSEGSAVNANKREYKDGPNFNQRLVEKDQVLYAIRNGGFSSGPMPQNIVVGEEAEQVAEFVSKYSGSEVERAPDQNREPPVGASGESSSSGESTE